MSTSQKEAHSKSFGKWECDIGDVRVIYEKTRHSSSWVRSGTLLLVEASLGFQILTVVRVWIGFLVFST